jgi:ABC-type uncharacterized transport system permease subunit
VNIGLLLALAGVAAVWIFLFRTYSGYAQQVGGLAPAAARYAGFSSRKALVGGAAHLRRCGRAGRCAGGGRA